MKQKKVVEIFAYYYKKSEICTLFGKRIKNTLRNV